MLNTEKKIWKKREERVNQFIYVVLDDDRDPKNFADACLMHCIRMASRSADRLSSRVMWLNVTLVVLGVLGLAVAAYEVFFK